MKIDGFDVEDGLKRTMGDSELYLQLLLRFRDGQCDIADQIRLALRQDDRALAERLAHTLKSVAGLVGARGMQSLAEQLEGDIGHGIQPEALLLHLQKIAVDMQLLMAALTPVLAHLDGVVSAVTNHRVTNINRTEVSDLIQRGVALLANSEGEAINWLGDNTGLLTSALGISAHKEIEKAVRGYNFDSALAALVRGAEKAGYIIYSGGDTTRRE